MASMPALYASHNSCQTFNPEVGAMPFPGYRLLRLRGRGGFATVWESTTPTGERVALKFMSSAAAGTTSREVRSLQAVKSLSHPSLLPIRQVWSIPGCIVIAMDLAEASLLDLFELYLEELGTFIEFPKLSLHLHTVAESLDFLNARRHRIDGRLVGLQHGDIKPNNILLVNDRPMLADYGLATPTSGTHTPCPRHGTAEYCPPEVFQGYLSDRSDQFSLAVTYHVLRTGLFPFPKPPGVGEALRNYVRPEANLSALSAVEKPIVARAMHAIPQNRYATCLEFMNALLRVNGLQVNRDDEGITTTAPYRGDHVEPPKSQLFRLSECQK